MKTHTIPDETVAEVFGATHPEHVAYREEKAARITITPQAASVQPLNPELPDPENAYTVAQVRENLIEMEQQLEKYPLSLSGGPGWVRHQILSILDRGMQDERLFAAIELGQINCDEVYDDLRKERDTLRAIAAKASLRILYLELMVEDLQQKLSLQTPTLKDGDALVKVESVR